MAHLSGGIASVVGRIRSYQDKDFWATAGNPRHGRLPERDFDHYLRERLVFDTAGFCGAIQAVKIALVELPSSRIVFATDYPQEIPRAGSGAGICDSNCANWAKPAVRYWRAIRGCYSTERPRNRN